MAMEMCTYPGFLDEGSSAYPAFAAWQKFELDETSTASNVLLCADAMLVLWNPEHGESRVILEEQYIVH